MAVNFVGKMVFVFFPSQVHFIHIGPDHNGSDLEAHYSYITKYVRMISHTCLRNCEDVETNHYQEVGENTWWIT